MAETTDPEQAQPANRLSFSRLVSETSATSESGENENSRVEWKTVGLGTVVSILLTASAIAGYHMLGPQYITHQILNQRIGESDKQIKDLDNKTTISLNFAAQLGQVLTQRIDPELHKVLLDEHAIEFKLRDTNFKINELAGALEETAKDLNFSSSEVVLDALARGFGSGDNARVAKLWKEKTGADNVTSFGDDEHKTLYAFFSHESKNFTEAIHHCKKFNFWLAVVDTSAASQNITKVLEERYSHGQRTPWLTAGYSCPKCGQRPGMLEEGWITHNGVKPISRTGNWRGNWKEPADTRKSEQKDDFMFIGIDEQGLWELQGMNYRGPFICSKSF